MNNKKEKSKPVSQLKQIAALSGIAIQMGLTIYLGFLLGKWLDAKFDVAYLKEGVTLLAVFTAIYLLIRQAKKLND